MNGILASNKHPPVLAATLIAPERLELRHYPYPEQLEPDAVPGWNLRLPLALPQHSPARRRTRQRWPGFVLLPPV